MDDRLLDTLRAIAWEHVKGELRAMLVTYYPEEDGDYFKLRELIDKFVKRVEDEIGV